MLDGIDFADEAVNREEGTVVLLLVFLFALGWLSSHCGEKRYCCPVARYTYARQQPTSR